jgi:hypothetical protein
MVCVSQAHCLSMIQIYRETEARRGEEKRREEKRREEKRKEKKQYMQGLDNSIGYYAITEALLLLQSHL